MKTDKLVIKRWFDRHLHIRKGAMMQDVFIHTLLQRPTGAVIMPNPKGMEITYMERALQYREEMDDYQKRYFRMDFEPCLTLYLTDQTPPGEVVEGFRRRLWRAVKVYLVDQKGEGGTTNSHLGVRDLLGRYGVFEHMEEHQIPLLGHFEAPEDSCDEFDREIVSFERDVVPIMQKFPKLPIVFEHITDSRVAECIAMADHNIQATVTAHHLMINRNALFKGGLSPLHWCKPVAKREVHRLKIREYVTSGPPKNPSRRKRFGAGTDSAPHDEDAKAKVCGCAAGIFTAPCAVELYTTVFDEENKLENLEDFLSKNFVELYGMKPSEETMTIERTPFEVPRKVGNIHVFKGGETLPWKLVA